MKSHACVYQALVFWKLCAEVLSCFDLLIAHCLKYQLKMFLFCGEIKILSKWPLLGSLSLWTRRVQIVSHMQGAHGASVFVHPKDRSGKSPWTTSLSNVSYLDHHRIICFWLYLMLNCHSTNLNLHTGRFLSCTSCSKYHVKQQLLYTLVRLDEHSPRMQKVWVRVPVAKYLIQ